MIASNYAYSLIDLFNIYFFIHIIIIIF